MRVGLYAHTERSGAPHIKLGRRDLKHPIHESHRIITLVVSDIGVLHGDSLAKNTSAFFFELTVAMQNHIVPAETPVFLF
jgi:hypothetical protein